MPLVRWGMMRNGDGVAWALEPGFPEHLVLAPEHLARGQPGHLPVGFVPVPRLEVHGFVALDEGPKLPDCA